MSSVATFLAPVYNVSVLYVNMCALMFGATYVPCALLAIWLFETFSPSITLRLGSLVVCAGMWLRSGILIDNQFSFVLAGMTVVSTQFAVFLSANTLICNRWFPDNERGLATAISSMAVPFGSLVSLALSGLNFIPCAKYAITSGDDAVVVYDADEGYTCLKDGLNAQQL